MHVYCTYAKAFNFELFKKNKGGIFEQKLNEWNIEKPILNNLIGMALYGKLSLRYRGSVSSFMDMYNFDAMLASVKA